MIDQSYKPCEICGLYGTEVHHVFGGPNRKHSETYNLTIRLCRRCHEKVHKDKDRREILRKIYQKKFEAEHGHEQFMAIFGTNYLEEGQWKV